MKGNHKASHRRRARINAEYERGRSEGYGEGYIEGKDKAYFEIESLLDERANGHRHAAACGCRGCAIVRRARALP